MNDPKGAAANRKMRAPWIFILAITVIFFVVNALLAYRSTQILNANADRIEHSLNIIALIRELQVQFYAAESGQRGYLITSDPQYLEPFHATREKMLGLLNTLGQKSTELAQQQERFREIQRLMREKVEEMDRSVEYVAENKTKTAIGLTNTDRGVTITRSIMQLIGDTEKEERSLLRRNRLTAKRNQSFILWTLLAANGVGLTLSLAIFFVSLRYTRNIKALYQEIEAANQELEDKVRERTNTLTKYSEELERSNRELQDFAFVASHDLQEPLRKIRAFGDRLLLKFSDSLGEQGVDYTRRMQAASERMSVLINDLLSFSRVTTRQKNFILVDLNTVLARVIEDLEYAVEQSNAEIISPQLPKIHADDSQLRQVFANLLSNSMKFMPKDRRPRIEIGCGYHDHNDAGEPQRITLTFADNGIGFDVQYKDRIFNLFQRLHSRDEYSGTGIGLALCRKIIERHDGTIDVQSVPGQGTTFTIDLPIYQTNISFADLQEAV